MPYNNVPESMWGMMDKCVEEVQGKGNDKESAIAICHDSLMTGKELLQAIKEHTAKETGPASDYLIVEDREQPSTYHLRVKKDGTPDHTLMGAAWAALHEGYRGNKYEGPNKQDAIAKLKRLYEAEGMPVPSEKESLFVVSEGAELTDAELQAIERLYQDVKAGKVTLSEPETATGKASVSYGNRSGGTDGPAGNPADTPGWRGLRGNSEERCFLHAKRLGADETTARRICRNLFGGVNKEAQGASFTVYKQADGTYRWVSLSSTAYRDRDREILSTKSLANDCDRADSDGKYGPLRWWHVGLPDPIAKIAGPGLDIGDCDFNAMHGKTLIESGTFKDSRVAEMVKEQAPDLAVSVGFFHPITEPDAEGVYHTVYRFERSILPRERASNPMTGFFVAHNKEVVDMATFREKIEDFKKKFKGNEALAEQIATEAMQNAELREAAAKENGVTSKETQPATPPAPESKPEQKETPILEQPGMFVADMKPEEFDARIAAAVQAAVKPLLEQINGLKEANATAVKESSANVLAAALTEIKKLQDAQAQTAKDVAALNGLTPRGYRASQDPATITTKDAGAPKADEQSNYFAQFVGNIMGSQPTAPKP